MARLFFPTCKLAYESTKSQDWETEIQTTGSGKSKSMTNQLYPKWIFKVSVNWLTDEEARALQGFIASIKGANTPFFWLDPEDYDVKNLQLPQVSPGLYQPLLKMGDYVEPVEYIDKLSVWVDGTKLSDSNYSLTAAGFIRLKTTPTVGVKVTASYRYYWKVRLDSDGIDITHEAPNYNKTGEFKMVIAR